MSTFKFGFVDKVSYLAERRAFKVYYRNLSSVIREQKHELKRLQRIAVTGKSIQAPWDANKALFELNLLRKEASKACELLAAAKVKADKQYKQSQLEMV
jgi:hypothetical protein